MRAVPGELHHQPAVEEGIDPGHGPRLSSPDLLQLRSRQVGPAHEREEPPLEPALASGVDKCIQQGASVVDGLPVTADDPGPQPLLAGQPKTNRRVDRILHLIASEPEEWRVEDPALGRNAADAIHGDRVCDAERQRCRHDSVRGLDIAMGTPDQQFDRGVGRAREPIEAEQARGGPTCGIPAALDIGHSGPHAPSMSVAAITGDSDAGDSVSVRSGRGEVPFFRWTDIAEHAQQ